MKRPILRLARHEGGGSAVEFALIGPVLVAILAGLVVVWSDVTAAARMRSAVHAGAVYLRAGGADHATVRTVVERSWDERPDGSEVTVTESCTCGGVVGGCAALCPSGDPPLVYVTVRAATGDTDQMIGRTVAEVVRVR